MTDPDRRPVFARSASPVAAGAGGREVAIDGDMVRSAYARWAPVYTLLAAPTALGRKAAVAKVNSIGGHFLEAGVGTGLALPDYTSNVTITGVDLSHDMLVRANEKIEKERLRNVTGVHEMDLTNLAFADGAFDGTVCMFTITAVPDAARVMDELARVVRPGGHVVICSHFRAERFPWTVTDRILTPFATRLGWNPSMKIDGVLGCDQLELVSREDAKPAGLFDLLTFRKR
ncbi:phosphatidylethanolamine/phosphatidyl-N-methylethanolamine N-methyltransferase [Amorphus suaedae]